MQLAILLHAYQPPTQPLENIQRIVSEAYRPILARLGEDNRLRLTLNISPELVERLLSEPSLARVVADIRRAAATGNLELTSTAYCHWILPRVPIAEARKQILLGRDVIETTFGVRPRGFFPPEMCVSEEVLDLVADCGSLWAALDQISASAQGTTYGEDAGAWHRSRTRADLTLVLRHRELSRVLTSVSRSYPRAERAQDLEHVAREEIGDLARPIFLADDLEHFGHHQPGRWAYLETLATDTGTELFTFSEGIACAEKAFGTAPAAVVACSWASRERELKQGIPYALWDDPSNDLHQLQWGAAALLLKAHKALRSEQVDHRDALRRIGRSLHSDPFWWASCRPNWSLDFVTRGAALMRRTGDWCRQVGLLDDSAHRELAEHCDSIEDLAERWERDGIARSRIERFREEIGHGPEFTFTA